MCLGHTLLFHDMLYALGVYCNLLSVIDLLKLGFKFHIVRSKVEFYLNKTMYRQDLLSNGLFMLDLDSLSSYVAYDNTIDSLN